jgi:hypothetical protein
LKRSHLPFDDDDDATTTSAVEREFMQRAPQGQNKTSAVPAGDFDTSSNSLEINGSRRNSRASIFR